MRIHLIAIGGAVMHNLALALQAAGHEVSGSDDEIYNPSRDRLEKAGLLPDKVGWDASRISKDIDKVILGMHARKGNPEIDRAVELGIPVSSFPEFIYEMSKDKKRVVVGGSHGKTTTTSMIMHACVQNNIDIDYLVGAQLEGFTNMVKLSDAEIIIIEGDEYPSSALDRRSKFLHYKPHIATLTGIAWDHINVFPEFEDYVKQFRLFIESIVEGGLLFYDEKDELLKNLVEKVAVNIQAEAYDTINYREDEQGVKLLKTSGEEVPISIFGSFNISNLAAAQKACAELGISYDSFVESMSSFKGAMKRQQILGKKGNKIAYLDFAHAPSKVRATSSAMIERYGGENIIACLELHTYSSLSKEFLSHYKNTLDGIGEAMVFYSPHTIEMKKLSPISPDDIKKEFDFPGLKVGHVAGDIQDFIRENGEGKTVLLFMSSGKFGNLHLEELTDEFLEIT